MRLRLTTKFELTMMMRIVRCENSSHDEDSGDDHENSENNGNYNDKSCVYLELCKGNVNKLENSNLN